MKYRDLVKGVGMEGITKLALKTSVADPDPCVSVLKWLPWIRVRIGNTDPDPGQSKWRPKRENNQRFQLEKSFMKA